MATIVEDNGSVMPADLVEARHTLQRMLDEHNFLEPNRGDLTAYDKKVWRTGMPDYTVANIAYLEGKSMNHEAGSLGLVVENLVKTWEMEASHVVDTNAWTTIDHAKYQVSANGGKVFGLAEASSRGNYNVLMEGIGDKTLWDSDAQTFESSHHAFRSAFTEGFPWEVLEVFSGPPRVTFTWRHWAKFTGEYKGNKGSGEVVELYGFCVATVDANLKVQTLEIYYKPEQFLRVLEGKYSADTLINGKSLVGPGCPFMSRATATGVAAKANGGGCPFAHGGA